MDLRPFAVNDGESVWVLPGGLTRAQVRRIIADLDEAADVVGLSIAEFIPRSVLAMEALVDGLPLTER